MLAMTFSVSLFVEHSVCFDPRIISRSSLVFQRIPSTLARIPFILACSEIDSVKILEFDPIFVHSLKLLEIFPLIQNRTALQLYLNLPQSTGYPRTCLS